MQPRGPLGKLQKALAIDQRNLIRAEVLSVAGSTCKVRLPDGGTITAGLGSDLLTPGNIVEVATSGRTYTVANLSPLVSLDGERIVQV